MTRCARTNIAPLQDTILVTLYQGFGSAHPGVFQVAWCDGSVDALSFDIELDVHNQNGTRGGIENPDLTGAPKPPDPPAPPPR